jgi:hypothetical protein
LAIFAAIRRASSFARADDLGGAVAAARASDTFPSRADKEIAKILDTSGAINAACGNARGW